MKTLKDKDSGKELKVASARIGVSANERCPDGIFVDVRVHAVFPGCRKEQLVSVTPMGGYVWAKPLFGYSGTARINPEEWRAFLRDLPVESDRLFPVTMTLDLAAKALAYAEQTCDACYEIQKHDEEFRKELETARTQ